MHVQQVARSLTHATRTRGAHRTRVRRACGGIRLNDPDGSPEAALSKGLRRFCGLVYRPRVAYIRIARTVLSWTDTRIARARVSVAYTQCYPLTAPLREISLSRPIAERTDGRDHDDPRFRSKTGI